MSPAAAKAGDKIEVKEMHPVQKGNSTVPTTFTFTAIINGNLSKNVLIEGDAAATIGSTATQDADHSPEDSAATITPPPLNTGTVTSGSGSVLINGKAAARHRDSASGCTNATLVSGEVVVVAESQTRVRIGNRGQS